MKMYDGATKTNSATCRKTKTKTIPLRNEASVMIRTGHAGSHVCKVRLILPKSGGKNSTNTVKPIFLRHCSK